MGARARVHVNAHKKAPDTEYGDGINKCKVDLKRNIYPKTDRTSAVNVKRFEHIMCINTRIFREKRE